MIIYDAATRNANRPPYAPIAYVNSFWLSQVVTVNPDGTLGPVTQSKGLQESGTRWLPHAAQQAGATAIILDMEGNDVGADPATCTQALAWVLDELTKIPGYTPKISMWDVPHVLLGDSTKPADLSEKNRGDSRAVNDGLMAVADSLDFLCPVAYWGGYMASWIDFAKWLLAECRSMDPGKPAILCLSPRDLNSDVSLPMSVWTEMLAFAKANADGFIVYDPIMTQPADAWSPEWFNAVENLK